MPTPTLQLKVARVSQLTADITSFRLEPHQQGSIPAFSAGAHIDVHLPGGLIRQYSLCNCPNEPDHYLIAVKRELNSRGGSKAMHEVTPGSTLMIGPPRNNFPIRDEADFHLLLAGGIGVTPLLSMARHLQHANKPFQLEHFGRSADSIPFSELMKNELGARVSFNIGLEPHDVSNRMASILCNRSAEA